MGGDGRGVKGVFRAGISEEVTLIVVIEKLRERRTFFQRNRVQFLESFGFGRFNVLRALYRIR